MHLLPLYQSQSASTYKGSTRLEAIAPRLEAIATCKGSTIVTIVWWYPTRWVTEWVQFHRLGFEFHRTREMHWVWRSMSQCFVPRLPLCVCSFLAVRQQLARSHDNVHESTRVLFRVNSSSQCWHPLMRFLSSPPVVFGMASRTIAWRLHFGSWIVQASLFSCRIETFIAMGHGCLFLHNNSKTAIPQCLQKKSLLHSRLDPESQRSSWYWYRT